LIDENLKPGTYSVGWDGCREDGERVSSGVYFYRIESNDDVETRQMMFLK
jgi:methionine-rich copper-binding protein CopC